MSDALLRSIEQEIATIRRDLASDPRVVKLEALKQLRRLYAGEAHVSDPAPRRAVVNGPQRGRTMKPERAEALRLSKEYLANHPGRPVKTAELYEAIEFRGCSLPGQNPANNLASLLIRAEGIKSHGRAGWSLESETPEAADDLLSGSASAASISSVLEEPDNLQ